MIVVDSSALVLFLTDRGSRGAAARRRIGEEDTLAAPYLLDTEIASALLGLAHGAKIDPTSLDEHFKTYQGLRLQRHETGLLLPRVRKLYANLSAYDATYVALAETLGVPLLTADARIKRGVQKPCCAIEVITPDGDHPPRPGT
ncbi:type II toxin-antitoxin system VapC family toxin [Streptomyces sp. ISL-66]|uniref:type II toxin-antitoxin system VapC family toxin n=1 Tax=Streptomyces sp. ISL-66 TaxID=2819186 RepID=UPI001BE90079|nr:type II toxin-antitoxin system VapC family toxin [Streptomyces sp. ISL-66]MBT2472831.1 type II toxin-antitoxin system VapC family toxin [Streptomyces sp. ISL-66]